MICKTCHTEKEKLPYKKHSQCSGCYYAEWVEANRARRNELDRANYARNPEKRKKNVLAWQGKNPDKRDLYKARWRRQNPGASAAYRAALFQAIPAWAEMREIAEFYRKCPKGYHVDHIIPLRGDNICGLHVLGNLQYLSASENMRKGNRYG